MSNTKESNERLEEICRLYPERFFKNGMFEQEKAKHIYLPDRTFRRQKAYYAQIMKAVKNRKELLPLSVGLSADDIQVCFKELAQLSLIRVVNKVDNPTTLDFILTLQGEEWCGMKKKVEWLVNQAEKFVPDVYIA